MKADTAVQVLSHGWHHFATHAAHVVIAASVVAAPALGWKSSVKVSPAGEAPVAQPAAYNGVVIPGLANGNDLVVVLGADGYCHGTDMYRTYGETVVSGMNDPRCNQTPTYSPWTPGVTVLGKDGYCYTTSLDNVGNGEVVAPDDPRCQR